MLARHCGPPPIPSSAARADSRGSGPWDLRRPADRLLRIDDIENLDIAHQLLHAHQYWRMKRLAVDLVILNERASSYVQDLQIALETRSGQVRRGHRAAKSDGRAVSSCCEPT